ncbi:MAG: TIR domain-containing protein [Acidobacteriia bacterium]|nr:TIR domain-containing protein [Terriglobia bacterium]
MQEIFISYARKDKDFVHKLHTALAAAGRDTWVDWEDIPPTTEWLQEIFAALEGVQAVVFVVSPDSITSPMCAKEVEHAASHHKRLIPVVIADVNTASVGDAVARLQWLFFRPQDDFNAAFASLLQAIDTDIDWVRTHTRLLTRAIEWQAKQRDASLFLRGNDLKEAEASMVRGAAKQPSPTALQSEYVAASRRAAARRQRTLIGALASGLVITTVLAVTAWRQRQEAIAQRDEAIRQRNAVMSKQLAAYSELLRTQSSNLLDRATLLAIEAARHSPGPEADRALRQTLAILPALLFEKDQQRPIQAVAISPDGEQVASAEGDAEDGTVSLWRVATGDLITESKLVGPLHAVVYSPDGTLLAAAGPQAVQLLFLRDHREQSLLTKNTRRMVFSADSHLLITASGNDVQVWNAASSEQIRVLSVGAKVQAIAISPDSKLVAAGGDDNIVHVWDLDTGEVRLRGQHDPGAASMPLRLGSRDGGVFALAFYKDGNHLASGGQDHSVRVWDITSGREVFRGYQADSVYGVAFSPVAPLLASGGMDGTVRVWDLSKGDERYRLQHDGVVDQVMWDTRGNLLSVSLDGTARLWDPATGKERARMFHAGALSGAAIESNGRHIVTAGYGSREHTSSLRVWDVSKAGEGIQLPHSDTRDVQFSPDGKHLVTVGETYSGQLWKFPEGDLTAQLPHENFVQFATFSPDSTKVVTSGWDGAARVWDANTGKMLADLRHDGRVGQVVFSADGRLLATAGWADGAAHLWDTASWKEVRRLLHGGAVEKLRRFGVPKGGVRFLTFSPDGALLATSGHDGTVRLWNLQTGDETLRLAHNGYAQDVYFSPDGRYLVSDSEKELVVWSLPSGNRVTALQKESDPFLSLLGLSPDGHFVLLSSQEEKAVEVRTMPDLKPVARLLHEHTVFSARFNRGGTRLLTASQDTTARLWDTSNWQEVTRMHTNGIVYEARFSPDERFLVTASGEGLARVWITGTADLAAAACQRMTRNLTPEEWRQYLGDEPYAHTCTLTPRPH